ncbi:MAG: hypothetical protein U0411_06370 [Thermodesulfovibrionales bacterium]
MRALEPNIKAFAALCSPETGILSAHALMDYFLYTAKAGRRDRVGPS